MSFIQHPFAPLFLIAAFLVGSAGISLLIRYQTPLARWGGILMLSISIDLVSYFLVITSATPDAFRFNFRMLVITYSLLIVSWTFFIFVFCGHRQWINLRTAVLVGIIPIVMAGLVLTHPEIDPLWIRQGRETFGSLMVLTREFGWFGNLFIVYTFGIGFLSMGLLIQLLPTTNSHFRWMAIILFAGSLTIVFTGLLEVTDRNPFVPIASIQLGYAMSSILAFLFVFGLRAGGMLPIARNAAFEHIQDGVLVFDQFDNIIDLNTAAMRIIGPFNKSVVGKPLSEVWKHGANFLANQLEIVTIEGEYTIPVNGLELTFDVKISPVLDFNQERIGRIVVLRNVTGRERMEKALQEHAKELTRTNKLITALSMVALRLGTAVDSKLILDTLGTEMRKLGLDCGVVSIDPSGEIATIKYVSFNPALLKVFEKIAGFTLVGYVIPKQYWPGDRLLKTKAPTWYSNPKALLRGLFAKVPEEIVIKARQLFNIQSIGQMCILPLISEEKVIGAMPVWGVNLQQEDSPILAVFASQVAGILQKATAYESEIQRADELSRSNSMILALSTVATQLESSSDSAEIFEVVGKELKKIGMDSIVGILDDSKQTIRIKYISIKQDVIRWAEKATGHSLSELTIPRRLWPTEKVVEEKVPYWDPNLMKGTLNMFPILPESMHKAALKMAGINLNDPVCYLPLANEIEVIGVLAVWGKGLKQSDASSLNVLASQLTTAIRNSALFESESRRAMELGILLEASEATSSSVDLSEVLLSLASKLLELSGFESCYISEWDKATNKITGLIDHSRVFWSQGKRDSYSLSGYPRSKEVLLTGNPIILQGDFESEEKEWMNELGRTALIILALKAQGKTIGLVEIAITKENVLFDPQVLHDCEKVLGNAALSLIEPLSENNPGNLFALESALIKTSGGEVCSFSEWDQAGDQIHTLAVSADIAWAGKTEKRPEEDPAWKMALYEGKASFLVRSEGNQSISIGSDSYEKMEVESTIIFPLQRGDENIGLIELYDFNHKRVVTSDQVALLRTVADKASYSIQNARLLQQTQIRLGEKTALLNEKEVLLKEVHHRVKNNLQVISSLLNLQSAKISDPGTKDILRESQNRVRTMALIHEKLYQSTDLAQIDFASYLKSLVTFLSQSYRSKSDNVSIQVDAQNVMLDINTALPCGLIINELVSNSLKYAFPNNQTGNIIITCNQTTDGANIISVSDDGVGLPAGFNISINPSLGLKLVSNLVNQLQGKLDLQCDKGTTFRISFNN